MAAWYAEIKLFHLLTIATTALLLILRFWWLCTRPARLQQRWVKILPHLNDTLLLTSGVMMVMIAQIYPFTPQGNWLTEKLFGVIIYIVLGFIALGRRPRSVKVRLVAFVVALIVFATIVWLATNKMPLLGFV